MSDRVLVVETPAGSHRFALPSMGAVPLGSSPGHPFAIDAELAPEHAVLYLDEGVALEVLHDDASWARASDTAFRPLKKGQTVELGASDRFRLGAAELVVVEISAAESCARVFGERAFRALLASRAPRAADVLARVRPSRALDDLHEAARRVLRPGDVVAELAGGDLAALLPDMTPSVAKKKLAELAGEALIGVAQLGEAAADELLALAGERLAPVAALDAARVWISDDPEMRQIDRLIQRAAQGLAHVLLLGETGVGKDVYAQLIHERSKRSAGPFVRVSCVEVSETLANDAGGQLFLRAKRGTLHIDEVTGLSPRAQLGLGYALEEAESAGLDVRFIASSNHDLAAEVEAGGCRHDLFYRIDQLQIVIPPLRQRVTDVLPLAELFLAQTAKGRARPTIGEAARAALEAYAWPGNVRELKNVIERAHLMAGSAAIAPEHLPKALLGAKRPASDAPAAPAIAQPARDPDAPQLSLREEMAALEKKRILEALRKYPTQREAAEALEMPMRTFLNRLDALGIARARGGGGAANKANQGADEE